MPSAQTFSLVSEMTSLSVVEVRMRCSEDVRVALQGKMPEVRLMTLKRDLEERVLAVSLHCSVSSGCLRSSPRCSASPPHITTYLRDLSGVFGKNKRVMTPSHTHTHPALFCGTCHLCETVMLNSLGFGKTQSNTGRTSPFLAKGLWTVPSFIFMGFGPCFHDAELTPQW